MRSFILAAALVGAATALPAQQAAPSDPDVPAAGGQLPDGWRARLDRPNAKIEDLKFVTMGNGYHVTTGPSTILYDDDARASGNYTISATLTQTKAPRHPEGYGIFVGGQSLEADPQQRYTYFLIRGDGKYLIKKRNGANVMNLISAWTPHPAIVKQGPTGEATNRLEVTMDKTRLVFRVNGKEVYSADPRLIDTKGVVGLRVNHNLDLHLQSFDVKKL